jgi:hypothetical protein
MALVTRASDASMSSSEFGLNQISGLLAGENIDVVAACYIKTSDGRAWMCNGAANTEPAEFAGFSPKATVAGRPITLFHLGNRFRYAAGGLGPGDLYYVAATAGRLDTAPTVGGLLPIARAVSDTDIVCISAGTV